MSFLSLHDGNLSTSKTLNKVCPCLGLLYQQKHHHKKFLLPPTKPPRPMGDSRPTLYEVKFYISLFLHFKAWLAPTNHHSFRLWCCRPKFWTEEFLNISSQSMPRPTMHCPEERWALLEINIHACKIPVLRFDVQNCKTAHIPFFTCSFSYPPHFHSSQKKLALLSQMQNNPYWTCPPSYILSQVLILSKKQNENVMEKFFFFSVCREGEEKKARTRWYHAPAFSHRALFLKAKSFLCCLNTTPPRRYFLFFFKKKKGSLQPKNSSRLRNIFTNISMIFQNSNHYRLFDICTTQHSFWKAYSVIALFEKIFSTYSKFFWCWRLALFFSLSPSLCICFFHSENEVLLKRTVQPSASFLFSLSVVVLSICSLYPSPPPFLTQLFILFSCYPALVSMRAHPLLFFFFRTLVPTNTLSFHDGFCPTQPINLMCIMT